MKTKNIAFNNIKEFENEKNKEKFNEIIELKERHKFEACKNKLTDYIQTIKNFLKTKPHCQISRQKLSEAWRFASNLYPDTSQFIEKEFSKSESNLTLKSIQNKIIEILLERNWKEQCEGKFGGPKPTNKTWKKFYQQNELELHKNKTKEKKLHWAITKGHINYFKQICDNEVIEKIKKNPEIYLHLAIKKKIFTITTELIDLNIDINKTEKSNKWSALFWAIATKNHKITELLINNKAKINIKDINHLTPLHLAALSNNIEALKLLIKNKAKINMNEKKHNLTPIECALLNNNTEAFEYLIKNKAHINQKDILNRNLLHIATLKENITAIKLLIENKIPINDQDSFGRTALHWATEKNNFDIVVYLIQNKAIINIKDQFDEHPLIIAANNNNSEIMNFLFKNGAR